MAISVSCRCGQDYDLKDEYADQAVQCPNCGDTIQVGQAEAAPVRDLIFGRDKFLLRQKHLSISEKYYVWDEQGNVILFVERPSHILRNLLALLAGFGAGAVVGLLFVVLAAIVKVEGIQIAFVSMAAVGFLATLIIVAVALSKKRHILFYRDDTRSEQLLEVKQDRKVHILNATYTLNDARDQVIARFRKNFLYDIFRKRWYCYRPDGQVLCRAMEDSIILSLLRRVLGPLLGILRINFVIMEGETENVIGEFNRKFTILDRYVLDMSADYRQVVDRRIALALGVLLDTGERR